MERLSKSRKLKRSEKNKMIEDKLLYYLAGFFDGEGSISLFPRNPLKGSGYFLRVNVTNTNREVLDILKEHFGGRIIIILKPGIIRKDCYRWTIESDKAGKFLITIRDKIRIKKERLEVAIKYLETVEKIPSGKIIPKEVQRKRKLLYSLMKQLNKKGKEVKSNVQDIRRVLRKM